MNERNDVASKELQQRISVGWILMAASLLMMSISQLVQAAIQTDFSEFAYHPGPGGWSLTCGLFIAYGVMALAVGQINAGWFRWTTLMLATAATLFTLGHHIDHLLQGLVGPTFGPFGVIQLHHVAGVLVVLQSFRWAKPARAVMATAGTASQAAN